MAGKAQAPELDIDEKTVAPFISWFNKLEQVIVRVSHDG